MTLAHLCLSFIGFSSWLVQYLVYLRDQPVWAINLIISLMTATITEVVSNTATANILLPIVKEMSLTLCQNPTYLGKQFYSFIHYIISYDEKYKKCAKNYEV